MLRDFQNVIRNDSESNKHLLLGNGFSIAWKPNIFKYESLYEQADFQNLSLDIKKVFESLKTKDFEHVMRDLIASVQILKVYSPGNKSLIKQIKSDAEKLKNILVKTIADNHPESPSSIKESEYYCCTRFLSNFKNVYTLNYDLLLYWTIMHYNSKEQVIYDDGFRTPEYGKQEYVTWEVENTNKQNIHYLHGALHLFDAGAELQKYTWVNTGITLLQQIKAALDKDFFPVFVVEGESKEKKERINHSNYLSRSYRSFSSIGGAVYIEGHSLAQNDNHIIELIPKSKVRNLFVGIFGDHNTRENKLIIRAANALVSKRKNPKIPLSVEFFNS